jgi:antirestriction protein
MTTWNDWLQDEILSEYTEDALNDYLRNEHKDFTDDYEDNLWDNFKESLQGQYDKFEDFVEERFTEQNEIPAYLENFIDFSKVAADWRHDYWISEQGFVYKNL